MHTCIGPHFMTHERLRPLSYEARAFYIALYTCERVKMNCPGLWSGAIYSMAEATGFQPADADRNLQKLIEYDLVEWDPKACVLRFTEFLDTCDSPSNGNALLRWWRVWNGMKACPTRDAHVATLRKLMDDWCRENGKSLSKDHSEKWAKTFGSLPPKLHQPKPSRPGAVQQDLFDSPRTVPEPFPKASPVDNSGSETENRELMNSAPLGTIREPFANKRDPDPDQDPDLFFSSPDQESTRLPGDRDLSAPVVPRTSTKPGLALVPPPPDLLLAETMLSQLSNASGGKYPPEIREGTHAALCATIRGFAADTTGPPACALAGQATAALAQALATIGGDPRTRLSVWLSTPGAYLGALARARKHERDAAERSAVLAEVSAQLK